MNSYVTLEIKGKDVKEGMQVIIPDNMATDGTDSDDVIYG